MTNLTTFEHELMEGIPKELPPAYQYNSKLNHAPKRKDILSKVEKKLALKNALRYFPKELHPTLAPEFAKELEDFGRIYMLRYKPSYNMYARHIEEYPSKGHHADDTKQFRP